MPPPTSNRNRRHELLSIRPTLHPGQTIGRVIRACGENIYEVQDAHGTHSLFQLPKRLRHVAFIKRDSFVFVRVDETRRASRVRGDIEVVVLNRFLASLKSEPFWPVSFTKDKHGEETAQDGNEGEMQEGREGAWQGQEDEDAEDDWEIGSGNPNRREWDHSSSDEDSDSS